MTEMYTTKIFLVRTEGYIFGANSLLARYGTN